MTPMGMTPSYRTPSAAAAFTPALNTARHAPTPQYQASTPHWPGATPTHPPPGSRTPAGGNRTPARTPAARTPRTNSGAAGAAAGSAVTQDWAKMAEMWAKRKGGAPDARAPRQSPRTPGGGETPLYDER